MKTELFRGAATALLTPLRDGVIDYPCFSELIENQIQSGIDALVVCGTTGESAALADTERRELISFCVEKADQRVPVIAGTGSNNTAHTLALSRFAASVGADGLLLVTPYYNKPTQQGLLRHYLTVADAVDRPMLLYDVPGRTGVSLSPETCAELSHHPNIVGLKDAGDSLVSFVTKKCLCDADFSFYAGNDATALAFLALGGKGVISVVSNLFPRPVCALCEACFTRDTARALALQKQLLPLCTALFAESNPAPLKAAAARLGICREELRLPLCDIRPETKERLFAALDAFCAE